MKGDVGQVSKVIICNPFSIIIHHFCMTEERTLKLEKDVAKEGVELSLGRALRRLTTLVGLLMHVDRVALL